MQQDDVLLDVSYNELWQLPECHDRDNSRLAPSENARKANTGRRERVQSPPNRAPASEQREHARYLSYFSLSPLSPCTYYI